ncbi:hypothetical protein [Flavobacterium sp. KACC 22761]|uniref:hypothetical protein n=1 Tax=Flavobacterium sp. KACC 22761 TaxID=3092665 RepID=UPI002A751C0B|nr:hypothetical protein [Flavobacterium sp. KACC 22761]WPO77490.1 hypothetical protein SCB73_14570 [Flavobacterium sp. KACC 22761]
MHIIVTIVVVILAIIFIGFILYILLSMFGTLFFIGYVFKKSVEKKTPDFLRAEKLEMEKKVNSLKTSIVDWNKYSINDITNDLEYSYKKWITNKLTGHILAQDGNRVIAFQRLQRGIRLNCRILACSTEFKYFYEINPEEIIIEYNDQYFGKIMHLKDIFDSSNNRIGTLNRDNPNSKYVINFDSENSLEINKSYDNNRFVRNVFYERPNSAYRYKRSMMEYREPYPEYSLMDNNENLNAEEQKWAIAIGIYESVFYSFDFTFA